MNELQLSSSEQAELLAANLEEVLNKNDCLIQQISELNLIISSNNSLIDQQKMTIQKLSSEKQELSLLISQLTSVNQVSSDAKQDLLSTIQTLKDQQSTLRQSLQQKSLKIQEMTVEISEMTQTIRSLKKSNSSLLMLNKELMSLNGSSTSTISENDKNSYELLLKENEQLKKEKNTLLITIQGKDAEIKKLKSGREQAEVRASDAEQRAVTAEQTVRQHLDSEFKRLIRDKRDVELERARIEEDRVNICDTIQKNVERRTDDIEKQAEIRIAKANKAADERAEITIAEARDEADKKSKEICAKHREECNKAIERAEKTRRTYVNTKKWLIGTSGIVSACLLYICACILGNYPGNEIAADGEELIGWIAGGGSFISGLIGGIPWAVVRVIVWILAVLAAAALLITPIVLIKKLDGEWVYDLKNDEVSRTAFAISVSLPLFGTSALAARNINGIAAAAALYGIYIIIRSECILKLLSALGGLLAQSWDFMGELADKFRDNKETIIGWLKVLGMLAFTFFLIYLILLI